jgi:hypothetical protein
MRSPFTFVRSLMVFVLLALAACSDGTSSEPDAPLAESDQQHEDDHGSDHDDHDHGELYEPHTPDADADPAAVADAWLAAFTAEAEDTTAWLATLEPYCFSSYCELLAQTDAANLPGPDQSPTGPAVLGESDRSDAAVATAEAEGGVWTVSLLATADGEWQVWDCAWEVS